MCDSIEDLQFCDDLRSVNRSDAESSGNEPSQSSEQQGEQTAFGDGLKHALHSLHRSLSMQGMAQIVQSVYVGQGSRPLPCFT